jgi:hypothetical protein
MTRPPKFVVSLYDIDATDRSRESVKAYITDAKDIGVSSYANEGGEFFMTLPWNHPQIAEVQPWLRHYEVNRWNGAAYDVVGVGMVDEFDAVKDEVIVYGRDYLSLIDASISGANNSHVSSLIGTIVSYELSQAIHNPTITTGVSVSKFLTTGTIDATSTTVTLLTSYQPRLQFIRQVLQVLQSDSSVRPIVSVTRSSPFTISFNENAGTDRNNLRLEFGGLLNDFRYVPGFADFGTRGYAIGQKREGASLLFSNQTFASESTYGLIQKATVFLDIVDQASLDRKVKRYARDLGTIGKNVAIALRVGQLGPYDGYEIADSIPIYINRGIVSLNALFTVWGLEWIGKKDGSEDLFLNAVPKET